MKDPKGRATVFFNRALFLGVGAGMIMMMLTPVSGGPLSSVSNSSRHYPAGKRLLNIHAEALSSPSTLFANYDWTVQSLDGQDFAMTRAKGKVVFLNFWATWCSPCVAEMASIQRLYAKVRDKGVVFFCVSNEDASKVSRFVKKKRYTFPIYTVRGSLPAVFNTQRVPATFILSRDGRIVLKHIGGAKWDDDKNIDFMKGLLNDFRK